MSDVCPSREVRYAAQSVAGTDGGVDGHGIGPGGGATRRLPTRSSPLASCAEVVPTRPRTRTGGGLFRGANDAPYHRGLDGRIGRGWLGLSRSSAAIDFNPDQDLEIVPTRAAFNRYASGWSAASSAP